MLYRCSLLTAAVVLSASACVATEPPTPEDGEACPAPVEDEPTSEAVEDMASADICTGVCQAVSAVGCGPAIAACAEGVAVSAGAALIPCALAVPLACLGGQALCTDACLKLFPLTVDEAYGG